MDSSNASSASDYCHYNDTNWEVHLSVVLKLAETNSCAMAYTYMYVLPSTKSHSHRCITTAQSFITIGVPRSGQHSCHINYNHIYMYVLDFACYSFNKYMYITTTSIPNNKCSDTMYTNASLHVTTHHCHHRRSPGCRGPPAAAGAPACWSRPAPARCPAHHGCGTCLGPSLEQEP